jgi:hypothetical protein
MTETDDLIDTEDDDVIDPNLRDFIRAYIESPAFLECLAFNYDPSLPAPRRREGRKNKR